MPEKEEPHVCKFTRVNETLENLFPEGMRFRTLRRKFRESLLVSEENGRRCYTPEGAVGYLFEKEKQLTQNYHKIHPYSKFREVWEEIAIIEMIVCLTYRPFVSAQLTTNWFPTYSYQIPSLFLDLFELCDVALCFITGYIDKETRTVTLETRKVFDFHCRRFYFYFHLLSSLPVEFFIYLTAPSKRKMCKYTIYLKVFKLFLVTRYLKHIARIYNWSEICFRAVWTTIMMFLVINLLSCLFYLVVYENDFGESNNIIQENNEPFFRHCTIFYMIASIYFFQNGLLTHLEISTTKDIIFCCIVLVTTHLSNILFVGVFVQLLGLRITPFIGYQEMIQEVQKFLVQENIPHHVHLKVIKYFQFRFHYKYFQEKIILDTLSPPLRREIANFLCMGFLRKEESVFFGMPYEMACNVCHEMKFEVFLPGDQIFRTGARAKKMYFIYCGSVVVYNSAGKEITHLLQGQQFGESSISVNSRYLMTVLALEMTECYVLFYRDLLKCAADNPDFLETLYKRVEKKRIFYKIKLEEMKQ